MRNKCSDTLVALTASMMLGSFALQTFGAGDYDNNGFIDLRDYSQFHECLSSSGPGQTPLQACVDVFDLAPDGDVDLADFAVFERTLGHLPIPLKDTVGNAITVASTAPYSGRQTCGTADCHDVEHISNGFLHQQGRTDADGHIVMQDDSLGNGQWWVRSAGMYGRWSGGGGGLNRQTAGKDNASESVMDMTAFYWAGHCGGCHVGGGGVEFDRDGERYYAYYEDTERFQFGYERLGLTASDVVLDGDYAFIDDTDGSLSPAPWDATGVADPECLHCHRGNRTWTDGQDMHREWRAAVLGAGAGLVDGLGEPVPAFAVAGTAGQGWFSTLDTDADPPVLQIDYSRGMTQGDLLANGDNELSLAADFLVRPPRDQACWGCHLPGGFQGKRGTVWFDERDVMYAGFNNLRDDDPGNDIPPEESTACNRCHPGDIDHNFGKGDSPYARFRNELDWAGFRSCRECHLTEIDGAPNPLKDPSAPAVPGDVRVHLAGNEEAGPMAKISCQGCHVPYPLERANIVTDRSVTGTAIMYLTDEFLSADPVDPSNRDTSKWYPALRWKKDSDGVERLFPQKREVAIYWADWNQNGTRGDMSDDTIQPIILWRLRQITGNEPLPGVEDDNGDGKPEINHPAEMLLYMHALKQDDSYGRPLANNPVLVKGNRVWYEDPASRSGVSWFDPETAGVPVESFETFGLDHNVLAASEAWGAGDDCQACHRTDGRSPVFDRKILIDPFGPDGAPVYTTVQEMTQVNTTSYHDDIVLKDAAGNPLTVDSTAPYSGRQTCGTAGCHDLDTLEGGIMNGMKFQQGRTDVAGNVIMNDDYFEDGRQWQRSPGRHGIWSQATTLQMAGKENANESAFDQSTFAWIRDCSGCHTGGGPGEFDRDGQLLYAYYEDTGRYQFGYERLGKTAAEVALDGDYADFDYSTSTVNPARWDLTGLSGPDCLFCHRREPPSLYWREAALGAATEMVDNDGAPVQAFAAAATAGQRWVSNIEIVQEGFVPKAVTLQIDYSVGVADGSLIERPDGTVRIDNANLVRPPLDQACWICHSQKEVLDGMVWFDETPDIHYRKFNNLSDEDPNNDIAGEDSTACNYCHPGGLDHNFAKGNAFQFAWRDEQDWANFRTCRDCHLWDSQVRHADAPDVGGGTDTTDVHLTGTMMEKLSCQACHVPHALSYALLYFDSTAGGILWDTMCCAGVSMQYYSADPLDPTNPDKSRWYPALLPKTDSDGVERLFPCVPWPNIHWAEWDQNGTTDDLSDDVLTPIIQWRVYQVIGDQPLPVATDDDGDGRVEINRPEEILAYITALKGYDSYGRQVAARPVLVKGPRVWYEDPDAPDGVNSFEHAGTGIPVKWWSYNWGLDHNVLPKEQAWGHTADPTQPGCTDCHRPLTQDSPVFDRLVLVDPYGPDGQPVYKTVREMTGLNPP